MWTDLITPVSDALKSVFGLIDKAIPDKDKANEMKLDMAKAVMGIGSTNWIQANAFSIAMLVNFGFLVTMDILGKTAPVWSVWVALAWLAGPLLNTLSKETLGKIIELVKEYQQKKEEKK